MRRTISGRKVRKPHMLLKRAAFVLCDDYLNLTLANVLMNVTLAGADALHDRNVYPGEIAKAWQTLPDDLKKLKPDERLAYLKKKAAEREEIQKKITDLGAKRQKKIDEELAKSPKTDAEKALGEAFKAVIRDQAKAKGFEVAPEKK